MSRYDSILPYWVCPECGVGVHSEATAMDDWGGEEVGVGPECLECEVEMIPS